MASALRSVGADTSPRSTTASWSRTPHDWRPANSKLINFMGSGRLGAVVEETGTLQDRVEAPLELRGCRNHRQSMLVGLQQADFLHHVFHRNRVGVQKHRTH